MIARRVIPFDSEWVMWYFKARECRGDSAKNPAGLMGCLLVGTDDDVADFNALPRSQAAEEQAVALGECQRGLAGAIGCDAERDFAV